MLLSVIGRDTLDHVTIFFRRYRCSLFVPRPRVCPTCLVFGHSARTCRWKPRCARCGGPHALQTCDAPSAKCWRCGGPHDATLPICPKYLEEAARLNQCAHDHTSFSVVARKPAVQPSSYASVAARPVSPAAQSPKVDHSSNQSQHQSNPPAGSPIPASPPAAWDTRLRAVEAAVAALTAEVRRLRALIGDTRSSQANLPSDRPDTNATPTTFSAPTASPKSKRLKKSGHITRTHSTPKTSTRIRSRSLSMSGEASDSEDIHMDTRTLPTGDTTRPPSDPAATLPSSVSLVEGIKTNPRLGTKPKHG